MVLYPMLQIIMKSPRKVIQSKVKRNQIKLIRKHLKVSSNLIPKKMKSRLHNKLQITKMPLRRFNNPLNKSKRLLKNRMTLLN